MAEQFCHVFGYISLHPALYERNIQRRISGWYPHTERKHESRGRHQPIRDKLTSDVQVKLELVNTGLENVDKTPKS